MNRGRLVAVFVLFAVLAWSTAALAGPGEEQIARQEASCVGNISYIHAKIDQIVLWSDIFMIFGAVVAAIGSASAGFLKSGTQRKVAAVVGAVGAVVTILPKMLPDRADWDRRLASAEKHHTVGEKFNSQLVFAQPGESIVDAQKYVSARFTDCSAYDPPPNVPDLPAAGSGSAAIPIAATGAPIAFAPTGTAPPASPRDLPLLHSTRDAGRDFQPRTSP
jgi:hypothetical protein